MVDPALGRPRVAKLFRCRKADQRTTVVRISSERKALNCSHQSHLVTYRRCVAVDKDSRRTALLSIVSARALGLIVPTNLSIGKFVVIP